jgi:membrane protein DedA with SNARE-associated domain
VSLLTEGAIPHLLDQYGYWLVFVVVTLESMGLPLPSESLVIAAALYAGSTHRLAVEWVVAVTAAGAILGDNFGYAIGRSLGFRLLARYGDHVGLTERRLDAGRTLFRRHGAKVVAIGRFIAILRTFAALLAGASKMDWRKFLLANATGGIAWACVYGFGAAALGDRARTIAGPVGIGIAVVAVAVAVGSYFIIRRKERELAQDRG